MTRIVTIIFVALLVSLNVSAAEMQNVEELMRNFRNTIENRSSSKISDLLDNSVEITYNNQHSNFSRGQAILILEDFIAKNTPNEFKITYQGLSNIKDEHYILGYAKSANGVFNIYLYIKKRGNKFVIQELKIDK